MKRPALALAFAAALGLSLTWLSTAEAGGTYSTPTTVACSSRSFECSAGTCTETAPSTNAGFALANVQGYYVRICADSTRTLSGAGTMRDFHCSGSLTPTCSEIPGNALAVTASGVRCMEFPPFVVPYIDNTTDTMWWSPSGVTVSTGNLTIYICPNL